MSLGDGCPVAQGLRCKHSQLKGSLSLAVSALGLTLELACTISGSHMPLRGLRAKCVAGENGSYGSKGLVEIHDP